MNGPGWNPAVEPTLRIRPLLRAIISGRKARVRVRSETMLTWIISCSRRRSISAKGPLVPKPALFTRNWIWRPSRRTSSTTCPAAAGDERSAAITWACRPRPSRSSFAIASRRSRLRATSTTSCPSAANSFAYSEPSPADAPVMSTTLAEFAMTLDLPVRVQGTVESDAQSPAGMFAASLLEVHALEQLFEPRIGTNQVGHKCHLDVHQPDIVLGTCLLVQGERAVLVAQSDQDAGSRAR